MYFEQRASGSSGIGLVHFTLRRLPAFLGGLAVVFLCSGCYIIAVSGPTTVEDGDSPTYVLDVATNIGSTDVTLYMLIDVPAGWSLDSSTFEGIINGAPVSGTGTVVGSTQCDGPAVQAGFQRIRVAAGPYTTTTADTGTATLNFDVASQPQGEYKIVFRFGGSGAYCGPEFVRTINRDNRFLAFLDSIFDGEPGAEGLQGAGGVAVSPDGGLVVAAATEDQALTLFTRDPQDGILDPLGSTPLPASAPFTEGSGEISHQVAFSDGGAYVYVAQRPDDAIGVFARELSGLVHIETIDSATFPNLGTLREIVVHDEFLYALGGSVTDEMITIFTRSLVDGSLTLVDTIEAVDPMFPASGQTNSLAISPDGGSLYTVTESFAETVTVFSRDPVSGLLSVIQTVEVEGGGINYLELVTEVSVSPDGRNVYTASGNVMATFARDTTTGELSFVEAIDLAELGFGPIGPQEFVFSIDGTMLYTFLHDAACAFRRDTATGRLSVAGLEFWEDPPNEGMNGLAGIAVSPDGRHVYTGARFSDAVSTFASGVEVFIDGFESGSTAAWSLTVD